MLKKFLLGFLLLFAGGNEVVFSNPLHFTHFSSDQGLGSKLINCSFQDHIGFVWIGTDEGLSRYDGYRFINYNFASDNEDKFVLDIYEDRSQRLWILTRANIYLFIRSTEKFVKDAISPVDYTYSNVTSYQGIIFEDKEETLWVISPEGLFYYDGKGEIFLSQPFDKHKISAITEDGNGNLLLGTYNGYILKYNRKNKTTEPYKVDISHYSSQDYKVILKLLPFDNNRYLFYTRLGIYLYDSDTDQIKDYPLKTDPNYPRSNEIHYIKLIGNQLWIATYRNGILIDNLKEKTLSVHKSNPLHTSSITNNNVNFIYSDNDGVIWIGTQEGLNQHDPRKYLFKVYRNILEMSNSLSFNFVSCFCEEKKGKIWIGTYGGINLYDEEKETFRSFWHSTDRNSLGSNAVISIEKGNGHSLWIGTINGIDHLDTQMFRFQTYNTSNSSIGDDDVMDILYDSDHILWVATFNNGICHTDPDRTPLQFTNLAHLPGINFSSTNSTRTLIKNEKYRIYIGIFGTGLDIYDKNRKQFVNYRSDNTTHSISNNNVNSIHKDPKERIWIGTWNGLNLFDPAYEKFYRYSTEQGLPHNRIIEISSNDTSQIWITTTKGICSIRIDSLNEIETVTNYRMENGLQGSYFSVGASLTSASGNLYFGGINGFNRYDHRLVQNVFNKQVILTGIQLFNKYIPVDENGILPESLQETSRIILNHDQHMISFDFGVLSYTMDNACTYFYMLEGVDKTWQRKRDRNQIVNYSNLTPDKYKFRVKAQNLYKYMKGETTLDIQVKPPLWKTPAAYLCYILLFLACGYIIIKYQISRQTIKEELLREKLQIEKANEVNEMKLRFFMNISHEFKTPLALIISSIEKIMSQNETKDNKSLILIRKNAFCLLRLIEQLIDFRKIETMNMKLQMECDDLVTLIREVKSSFDEFAWQHTISFHFETDIESLPMTMDKDEIEKILFNLISNAFKYTPNKGEIAINLSLRDDENQIEINISDTGIRIPDDKQKLIFECFYTHSNKIRNTLSQSDSGIGLSLTKSLIELHGSSIHVQSQNREGSCFTVRIPYANNGFSPQYLTTLKEEKDAKQKMNFIFLIEQTEQATLTLGHSPATEVQVADREIILIVEDEPDLRKVLVELLSDKYAVKEASNGEEGLRKAIEIIPDLILSDVMMPFIDGIELCSRIKNDERTNHIPFILITAKTSVESALQGFSIRADDYINTPLLLSRISGILANRKRLREKSSTTPTRQKETALPVDQPNDPNTKYLEKINTVIEENLSDSDFNIDSFAAALSLSKTQLYRKVKVLSDLSPVEYIRNYRLQKATEIMKTGTLNISEIAYKVGFNDPLYFSRCFKKYYGKSPSAFM